MEFTVGSIVEGKVKSITKFGAFITLPGNRTGMVHISEIAHAYITDIHEHLTEGQDVKVMVIAVDPAGKINLSIKRTLEPPARPQRGPRPHGDRPENGRGHYSHPDGGHGHPGHSSSRPPHEFHAQAPKEPQSFDDMVKQFMQDSDSKISSMKQYFDKGKNRRR